MLAYSIPAGALLHILEKKLAENYRSMPCALVDRSEVARDLRAGNSIGLSDTTVAVRKSLCLVAGPEGRHKLRTQVFVAHLKRALGELGASLDTPAQN